MNYQLTCVCGHRFFVNEQQVAKPVTCPSCARLLQPVVTASPPSAPPPSDPPIAAAAAPPDSALSTPPAPPPADPIAASAEPTKRCPFCGEVILAIAKKCKHCGEFLDRAIPGNAPTPTPAPRSTSVPAATAPSTADIPPVFALSVSQWDNFWRFLILATLCAIVTAVLSMVSQLSAYRFPGIFGTLIVLGFIGWFFYIQTKNSKCYIRPTRIETEVGILSKDLNALELFRITDMELKQSLFERLLGIGTIRITSNDPQTPELLLYEIPSARQVYKYLQDQIPVATKQRGALFVER